MLSIVCCKAGASPPSDPCVPCLVLLITSHYLAINAGEVKFYRAPRCSHLLTLVGLESGLRFEATLLGTVEPTCLLFVTKEAPLIDHTPTIKSIRAFKLENLYHCRVLLKLTFIMVLNPFMDIPSTISSTRI